ncbi:MAG: ATP-binding protein [Muribaculaceae bacterium]|nr:ATP-binding protein [Muribaculaceae bacterium]
MKKSDIQSQAVIMCGISGSGKTYFARQLEKEGYIRLSTDNLIWEKVGSHLYELSNEDQKELFKQCNQEMRRRLRTLLQSGQKVVLDATHCKRSVRDEVRNICKNLNFNPLFLYCKADKEELWRRLSLRKGNNPDDLLVSKEQFSEYWNGFERPQEDETDFVFEVIDLR